MEEMGRDGKARRGEWKGNGVEGWRGVEEIGRGGEGRGADRRLEKGEEGKAKGGESRGGEACSSGREKERRGRKQWKYWNFREYWK